MKYEILEESLNYFCDYLKIPRQNKPTHEVYFDAIKHIPDYLFLKTMKHLYENWKVNHRSNKPIFPLISDILEAYRCVAPTPTTYRPEPRDDHAVNPILSISFLRIGYKAMDIIEKKVLQPIYGNDYKSGYNYTEKRDKMREFYHNKVLLGEVYDIAGDKWIKKNEVEKGKKYFHPEHFGW